MSKVPGCVAAGMLIVIFFNLFVQGRLVTGDPIVPPFFLFWDKLISGGRLFLSMIVIIGGAVGAGVGAIWNKVSSRKKSK